MKLKIIFQISGQFLFEFKVVFLFLLFIWPLQYIYTQMCGMITESIENGKWKFLFQLIKIRFFNNLGMI